MRFSIQLASYPVDFDSIGVCRQMTQLAQLAYKSNYEALFISQHYVTGPDTAVLQSFLLLG
jgi:alkanesulfonate monooxygenase SsuD/methylene tetrahydromethanopterin reductase-like flavin-dependent oxidoreductase (luciferase family)